VRSIAQKPFLIQAVQKLLAEAFDYARYARYIPVCHKAAQTVYVFNQKRPKSPSGGRNARCDAGAPAADYKNVYIVFIHIKTSKALSRNIAINDIRLELLTAGRSDGSIIFSFFA
jgi:hypothetical protein